MNIKTKFPDNSLRTCVHPSGTFVYGVHRPSYRVENLRQNDCVCALGWGADGAPCENRVNFPPGDVHVPRAETVFEVPNAFAFKGATFILKRWAEKNAASPEAISLPAPGRVSFTETLQKWLNLNQAAPNTLFQMFADLPEPLKLSIAETSTDPADLVCLAELSCDFAHDEKNGRPNGLKFRVTENGTTLPLIHHHLLFEMVANNIFLPDDYKEVMVLRPGVQGDSEIVGEFTDTAAETHVFEYLRQNSYIPGGHYAANNAHDAVRYRLADLSRNDMRAMRHFYYQRSFIRLSAELGLDMDCRRRLLSAAELEDLRKEIIKVLSDSGKQKHLSFNRTLWGWNFGFDYAPSGYRLHASHQQVHQQYAMVPVDFETPKNPDMGLKPFGCGDLIADFIKDYKHRTGTSFFEAYIQAIHLNKRMDQKDRESSLIIHSDAHIMVFVPKAQTSQWEIQLMTIPPVGNILHADPAMRDAIDYGILLAVRVLEAMGARMITSIEYSKAIDDPADTGQRLIYAFLPRLPESPGAFSEAQLRWINGHYPEDFAAACRKKLAQIIPSIQ